MQYRLVYLHTYMIIQLAGLVKFKTEKFVILDVNGVGYKVFVSFETLKSVPKKGEEVLLWTHLAVRENAMDIYGFFNYAELEFFEQLIQVSGIGPKSALSILAVAPLDTLRRAISTGETSYLTKVSGIGRRIAEKIVVELKDKLDAIGLDVNSEGMKDGEDALEALRSLGYSPREGREAIKKVSQDLRGVENIVKEALRNINKN